MTGQSSEMTQEDSSLNVANSDSAYPVSKSTCKCGMNVDISEDMLPTRYIYSVGRVYPRFPSISLQREYAQVIADEKNGEKTDYEIMRSALLKKENRYLTHHLCWVWNVKGLDMYILRPHDSYGTDLLLDSLRAAPSPNDIDIVIGTIGPVASPDVCNGLTVPIVSFDQIYSFDIETFVKSIPRPDSITSKRFVSISKELLSRIIQITDNSGSTDKHRALNYLAVRYHAIYALAAENYQSNSSLTTIEVRSSGLSDTRKIVDVIFSFTNRTTDVTEKFAVTADVTDEYPFLVTKLSRYIEH